MRKNFYDIIDEMDFDTFKEYETLLSLFEDEYIP